MNLSLYQDFLRRIGQRGGNASDFTDRFYNGDKTTDVESRSILYRRLQQEGNRLE